MNFTLDNNSALVLIVAVILITWTIRHAISALTDRNDVDIDEQTDALKAAIEAQTSDLLGALETVENRATSRGSNALRAMGSPLWQQFAGQHLPPDVDRNDHAAVIEAVWKMRERDLDDAVNLTKPAPMGE